MDDFKTVAQTNSMVNTSIAAFVEKIGNFKQQNINMIFENAKLK